MKDKYVSLEQNKEKSFSVFELYKNEILADIHQMIKNHQNERTQSWARMPVGYEYENEGRHYKTSFSSGKQQSVYIIEIEMEGANEELVYRPSNKGFDELYQTKASIRKHFPRLLISDQPAEDSTTKYYLIEMIRGYEEKKNREEFVFHLMDAEFFGRMVKEFFEISDDVLRDGLMINDINPLHGHNFIYNKEQDRFMFFDIDTVSVSDKSLKEKHIEYLAHITAHMLDRSDPEDIERATAFILEYANQLLNRYGEEYFHIQQEESFREVVLEDTIDQEDPNVEYEAVTFMDPRYNAFYEAMKYTILRKYRDESFYPSMVIQSGVRNKIGKLDADFVNIVKQRDTDAFKAQFMGKNFDSLYHTDYVTLPKNTSDQV